MKEAYCTPPIPTPTPNQHQVVWPCCVDLCSPLVVEDLVLHASSILDGDEWCPWGALNHIDSHWSASLPHYYRAVYCTTGRRGNKGVDQSNQRNVGLLHNGEPRGTLIIGILWQCVLLTAYHQLSSMLECKQHRLIGLQSAVLSLVFYLWGLSRCPLHRVTSVWCLIALSLTGSLWTATFDLSLKSKQAINLILSDQKTNIIAIWLQSE